ncbi:MAG: LexA family transcriptional regulator [Rhodobacteraceae bacterium]|nr:LexA family transcriptional regulator [Paracoccaceae bacterium]
MSETDGFRLKKWRKNKGLSQRDLAFQLGRSQGFVGNIEADKTGLSRDLIARMAERTSVNVGWLLTGNGDMDTESAGFTGRRGEQVAPPDYQQPGRGDLRFNDQEFTMISRFDIGVSAGKGLIAIEGEDNDNIAFSNSWLGQQQLNSDLCGLVRVEGDSMVPTIPDGSLALVHAPEMYALHEGIYAFSRNGEAFIKRLIPSDFDEEGRPRTIAIVADNRSYPVQVVSNEELLAIRIAGRIRAVISRF